MTSSKRVLLLRYALENSLSFQGHLLLLMVSFLSQWIRLLNSPKVLGTVPHSPPPTKNESEVIVKPIDFTPHGIEGYHLEDRKSATDAIDKAWLKVRVNSF